MSELLTKAREAVLLWRLAKIKFWLFTLVTLGVAWQSSTSNLVVSSLKPWELFNVFVGMFIIWGTNMVAFVDKTAGQVSAGRLPIGDSEPETIVTTTTQTAVKTTEPQETPTKG